mmetsp:Transcript_43060/g.168572  ORF Transcript_43060/g.168572 Transcript_43060/m.168572 type:complete len:90 (-) Transcript_43060:3123-3392(-)
MLVRLDALGRGKRSHKRVTGILSPRPPRQELFREIDPVERKEGMLVRLDALGQGKRNHKRVTGILSPRPPRQELFRETDRNALGVYQCL